MRSLIRAGIGLLAVFYVFVLYIVANPNVSAAYRDYYILRSTSLSVAERSRLQPLQLATTYAHRDPAIGFDGWSDAEESHRWSKGHAVKLIFRLDARALPAEAHYLVVKVSALGTQKTTWRLNDKPLAHVQVDAPTELRLPVGRGVMKEGENVLEIALPGARTPGNGDDRLLALAFHSLRLE